MNVEFIDVSNNNRAISWPDVAGSKVRGAWIKATEGTWFRDGYFDANWEGAMQNELWRGAYHFARPGRTPSGAAEAHYFCDWVLRYDQLPGDMYAIDLEEGPPEADLGAYVLDWCQTVLDRTGVKPLIYSTAYKLKHWHCNTHELAPFGLWLAVPGATTVPEAPGYWDGVAFYQYEWHGRVPGVHGDCDRDRFNGDEEALAAYGYGALG